MNNVWDSRILMNYFIIILISTLLFYLSLIFIILEFVSKEWWWTIYIFEDKFQWIVDYGCQSYGLKKSRRILEFKFY